MYVIYVIVSSILCAQLIKGATSWLNGLKSLARILQFVICNPCQSPPSLTILVPLWFISRATRLEVYPRTWFQSSVTCIGQYRRHVIKAQPSFHRCRPTMSNSMPKGKDISSMFTNGAIFSTFKHWDPHIVKGRSRLKHGIVNKCIFRYWLFCELKK